MTQKIHQKLHTPLTPNKKRTKSSVSGIEQFRCSRKADWRQKRKETSATMLNTTQGILLQLGLRNKTRSQLQMSASMMEECTCCMQGDKGTSWRFDALGKKYSAQVQAMGHAIPFGIIQAYLEIGYDDPAPYHLYDDRLTIGMPYRIE